MYINDEIEFTKYGEVKAPDRPLEFIFLELLKTTVESDNAKIVPIITD